MRGNFFTTFTKLLLIALVTLFILVPLRKANAQSCVDPPSGLVSWWPGDGSSLDVVGSNHGSRVGGTSFAPGKVDQAFSFDGIDDTVDFGPDNILGSGNTPFSVAFWMRPAALPMDYYFPIRLKQDTQFFIGLIRISNPPSAPSDYVFATFRDQNHAWWIPISLDALVNQWTHVTVIYNGGDKAVASSYEVFFNGIQLPFGTFDAGHVGVACNDNALGSDVGGNARVIILRSLQGCSTRFKSSPVLFRP